MVDDDENTRATLAQVVAANVRWRNAALGATAAAVLFSTGKHLFALYLAPSLARKR